MSISDVKNSPFTGKRRAQALSMRTTDAIRERMAVAARQSGRTLAGEVEYRLEQSFTADDLRLIVQQEVFSAVRDALAVALAGRADIPGERTEDEPSQRPQ